MAPRPISVRSVLTALMLATVYIESSEALAERPPSTLAIATGPGEESAGLSDAEPVLITSFSLPANATDSLSLKANETIASLERETVPESSSQGVNNVIPGSSAELAPATLDVATNIRGSANSAQLPNAHPLLETSLSPPDNEAADFSERGTMPEGSSVGMKTGLPSSSAELSPATLAVGKHAGEIPVDSAELAMAGSLTRPLSSSLATEEAFLEEEALPEDATLAMETVYPDMPMEPAGKAADASALESPSSSFLSVNNAQLSSYVTSLFSLIHQSPDPVAMVKALVDCGREWLYGGKTPAHQEQPELPALPPMSEAPAPPAGGDLATGTPAMVPIAPESLVEPDPDASTDCDEDEDDFFPDALPPVAAPVSPCQAALPCEGDEAILPGPGNDLPPMQETVLLPTPLPPAPLAPSETLLPPQPEEPAVDYEQPQPPAAAVPSAGEEGEPAIDYEQPQPPAASPLPSPPSPPSPEGQDEYPAAPAPETPAVPSLENNVSPAVEPDSAGMDYEQPQAPAAAPATSPLPSVGNDATAAAPAAPATAEEEPGMDYEQPQPPAGASLPSEPVVPEVEAPIIPENHLTGPALPLQQPSPAVPVYGSDSSSAAQPLPQEPVEDTGMDYEQPLAPLAPAVAPQPCAKDEDNEDYAAHSAKKPCDCDEDDEDEEAEDQYLVPGQAHQDPADAYPHPAKPDADAYPVPAKPVDHPDADFYPVANKTAGDDEGYPMPPGEEEPVLVSPPVMGEEPVTPTGPTGAVPVLISPLKSALDPCKFSFGQEFAGKDKDYKHLDYLTIWVGGPQADKPESHDFNPYHHGAMLEAAVRDKVMPVFYAYIIAEGAKSMYKVADCDVNRGGENLCTHGAKYIRENRATILKRYEHYAEKTAKILGPNAVMIWHIEPDFYQYAGHSTLGFKQIGGGLSFRELRSLYDDIVNSVKKHLPQAQFSWDVSPWVNGLSQVEWWYHFHDSKDISYLFTSGGRTEPGTARIRRDANNNVEWGWITRLTGKKIIADDGYGVNGAAMPEDDDGWCTPRNVTERIKDGVTAITLKNPRADWPQKIEQLRPILPPTCVSPQDPNVPLSLQRGLVSLSSLSEGDLTVEEEGFQGGKTQQHPAEETEMEQHSSSLSIAKAEMNETLSSLNASSPATSSHASTSSSLSSSSSPSFATLSYPPSSSSLSSQNHSSSSLPLPALTTSAVAGEKKAVEASVSSSSSPLSSSSSLESAKTSPAGKIEIKRVRRVLRYSP